MAYIGRNLTEGRSETFVYTASGGETSVSATDDDTLISYTVGWVKVWLNGVLLVEGSGKDFQATDGSTITGLAALTADDIITVEANKTFSSDDAVPKGGGNFTGPVKFKGGVQQQATQNLAGTYSNHKIMMSDAFTVTDNVTISDNIVLAKISDDGEAITLPTDDTTRTIEGSGSLETSTIAATPNSTLTGMTGTIGSDVVTTNITKLGTVTEGTFNSLLGNDAKVNIQYHFINSGENETTGDHEDLQANISGTQSTDTGFYVFTLNRDANDSVYSHTLPTGWTTENSLIMGFMSNDSTYKYNVGSTVYMTTASPAVLQFTTSSYWRNFRCVVWKYK